MSALEKWFSLAVALRVAWIFRDAKGDVYGVKRFDDEDWLVAYKENIHEFITVRRLSAKELNEIREYAENSHEYNKTTAALQHAETCPMLWKEALE